jgi:hypothetical protein
MGELLSVLARLVHEVSEEDDRLLFSSRLDVLPGERDSLSLRTGGFQWYQDLNCIVNKADATDHQDAKMSNSLKRVIRAFDMTDSFRNLFPKAKAFSRYYGDARG